MAMKSSMKAPNAASRASETIKPFTMAKIPASVRNARIVSKANLIFAAHQKQRKAVVPAAATANDVTANSKVLDGELLRKGGSSK